MVEIAQGAVHARRAAVMDEPTSRCPRARPTDLFRIIRAARQTALAIIYISHRMAEIYELSDRVSVLRDGSYVGTLEREALSARCGWCR